MMKSLLFVAAILALALARPEMYKESEDFQYARSSTDEGSKSGFYGAQRGNMGGNYERAHNMDGLAQHQMSTAVKQVEGELGDASKLNSGSVFTSANSGGMFGSGHYDVSNLQGRNFQENSAADSQSHASLSSHQSAYNDHLSSSSSGSLARNAGYRGYHGTKNSGRSLQSSNQQAVDNVQDSGYNYGSQGASHSSGYASQSGYNAHSAYDSSNSNANHYDTRSGYAVNPQNRLIYATPVKIVGRPGSRVAIPVGVQTYDATHSASTFDHSASSVDQNAINSEAEILNTDDRHVTYRPAGTPKHYESSYSYRKQWEKHDVKPEVIAVSVPTEIPLSSNSELYDDTQTTNNQYQASGLNSQSGFSSNLRRGYNSNIKSSSAAQTHISAADSRKSAYASDSNAYNHNSGAYNSGISAGSTNALGDIDSKPKSYQSSYSYHKAWERQGDPYEIKPEGGAYTDLESERLTAASKNQRYSSQNSGATNYHNSHQSYTKGGALENCDCDEYGNVRVSRSVRGDQPQEDLNTKVDQEDLGQQVQQNKWDNLEQIGQQQKPHGWARIESLGPQNQIEQEDLGQQVQQNKWENLEYLRQQQKPNGWSRIQDVNTQPRRHYHNQIAQEDLGQVQQNKWENLEDLGQQTRQIRWDNTEHNQEAQKQVVIGWPESICESGCSESQWPGLLLESQKSENTPQALKPSREEAARVIPQLSQEQERTSKHADNPITFGKEINIKQHQNKGAEIFQHRYLNSQEETARAGPQLSQEQERTSTNSDSPLTFGKENNIKQHKNKGAENFEHRYLKSQEETARAGSQLSQEQERTSKNADIPITFEQHQNKGAENFEHRYLKSQDQEEIPEIQEWGLHTSDQKKHSEQQTELFFDWESDVSQRYINRDTPKTNNLGNNVLGFDDWSLLSPNENRIGYNLGKIWDKLSEFDQNHDSHYQKVEQENNEPTDTTVNPIIWDQTGFETHNIMYQDYDDSDEYATHATLNIRNNTVNIVPSSKNLQVVHEAPSTTENIQIGFGVPKDFGRGFNIKESIIEPNKNYDAKMMKKVKQTLQRNKFIYKQNRKFNGDKNASLTNIRVTTQSSYLYDAHNIMPYLKAPITTENFRIVFAIPKDFGRGYNLNESIIEPKKNNDAVNVMKNFKQTRQQIKFMEKQNRKYYEHFNKNTKNIAKPNKISNEQWSQEGNEIYILPTAFYKYGSHQLKNTSQNNVLLQTDKPEPTTVHMEQSTKLNDDEPVERYHISQITSTVGYRPSLRRYGMIKLSQLRKSSNHTNELTTVKTSKEKAVTGFNLTPTTEVGVNQSSNSTYKIPNTVVQRHKVEQVEIEPLIEYVLPEHIQNVSDTETVWGQSMREFMSMPIQRERQEISETFGVKIKDKKENMHYKPLKLAEDFNGDSKNFVQFYRSFTLNTKYSSQTTRVPTQKTTTSTTLKPNFWMPLKNIWTTVVNKFNWLSRNKLSFWSLNK